MIQEVIPNLFRIQIPLPRNPLKFLNSYVIKARGRNLVIDTGLNREECFSAMTMGLQELDVNLENGQNVVEVGDIGYWPIGNAFCIFYGPTPMSIDETPRPASPVTVFGRVLGDATVLGDIRSGMMVSIEKKGT